MPSRLTLTGWLCLLVLCLCTALWASGLRSERDRYKATAEQSTQQLRAVQERLTASNKALRAAEGRASTAEATIRGALNANPSWRDSAVPADVRDRLCEYLSCAPVRP